MGAVLNAAFGWLVAALLTCWEFALELLRRSAFTMPDVTLLPAVEEFSRKCLWIVDSAYVLAILASAVTVMTYESYQIRYGVKELMPRLLVGLMAAHWSLPMCRLLLQGANSLTMALVDANLDPWAGWGTTYTRIKTDVDAGNISLLSAFLLIVVIAMAVWIFLLWDIRIAILIVLCGLAPLAMACYAVPQLEGVPRLWWRSTFGVLAVQVLQGATFTLGVALIVSPPDDVSTSEAPMPFPDGAEGHLLASLVVLMLTAKIPALVGRYVMQHPTRSLLGYISQVLIVQRLTRASRGGRRPVASGRPAQPQGQAPRPATPAEPPVVL
ncbi:hypothetical protein [Catellatospora paridis]|uniref:hypothetical protein n=1 Tax=Catellatospora paridis TaxID=1617086 RepID=UPI0012D3D707|nr:hypothetical protein [Catellatospora paridis]